MLRMTIAIEWYMNDWLNFVCAFHDMEKQKYAFPATSWTTALVGIFAYSLDLGLASWRSKTRQYIDEAYFALFRDSVIVVVTTQSTSENWS